MLNRKSTHNFLLPEVDFGLQDEVGLGWKPELTQLLDVQGPML